jgi:membrane protease YdiL (CAAX protease family)
VLAGALALALFTMVRVTRSRLPISEELALGELTPRSLGLAVAAVGGLFGASLLEGLIPPLGDPEVAARLQAALYPSWAGMAAASLAVLADELLFRGWLQREVGPGRALAVWTLVKTPLDPISGLLTGLVCAGATRLGGGVWPAVLARLGWLWVAIGLGMWS